MNATTCIALSGVLAASAFSVFADDGRNTVPGVITRAIEAEGVRLVTLENSTSPLSESIERKPKPALSDWSRVVRLARGTEVILTSAGSGPRKHRMVKADDFGVTIVNVDDPAIPAEAKRVLLDLARRRPTYFEGAQQGGVFELDKKLRLGPDGLFQGDRKVIGLAQIVQTIPRSDVVEISVLAKHIGSHTRRGLLIGAIAGTLVGVSGGSGEYAAAGAVVGAGWGLQIGLVIGVVSPRSANVIYRAK